MWGQILSGAISLGKMLFGAKQNSMANGVEVPKVAYQESPYAKDKLSLSKVLFNSRMPGAAAAEANITQNNSNTAGGIRRNATDSSQALAMLAASQAQTDNSFNKLQDGEAGYQLNMLNNINAGNDSMTQEWYKKYLDETRTQEQLMAEKNGLRQAAWQNIGNGANEASAIGGNIDLLKLLSGKKGKLGGIGFDPSLVTASNKPQLGLSYTPSDEVIP